MHPAAIASRLPDRPAVVMADSGRQISYRELAERTHRLAHLLRSHGIRRGDHVAVLLPNHERYFEVVWAAHISGVFLTPVNSHLTAAEAAYIINDCGAELVVTSQGLADLVAQLTPLMDARVATRLMVDGTVEGWNSYESATAEMPAGPLDDASRGGYMFYSSGTTGRPKGIDRPLEEGSIDDGSDLVDGGLLMFGLAKDQEVYLVTAPLYFSAQSNYTVLLQRAGATVVVMDRFDAMEVLRCIERYRVTFAQFVPTHFVRLLRLPEKVRATADVSSLRSVLHAGGPCPVDIKRRMIDWWGPIVNELYSSSEGAGVTWITSPEWLAHPGSVGRPLMGVPHILDAEGKDLPPGEPGDVWFEGIAPFAYRNDPEKSAAAVNDRGFVSVGDIGYVDEDGYLYLTERRSYLIISGGVNIYPREVEELILRHPRVADVAVFGVPDTEFGERVKAVVEPMEWSEAGPELAEQIMAHCRSGLAGYKCPRSVDFEPELPRTATGKLLKRQLRDRYLADAAKAPEARKPQEPHQQTSRAQGSVG